jgi:beta-lactamase regulating signal transducer with metallopeptidase domain
MEALLWGGLANAILAGVLALLAALVGWLFHRRPALVHAVWLLVLLKLITPPLLRPGLSWSSPEPPEPLAAESLPLCAGCLAETEDHLAAPSEEATLGLIDPPAHAVAEPVWDWPAVMLGLWLAGALGYWLAAGCRLARLHRLVAVLPAAPAEVQERVAALAAQLGLARAPRAWLLPGPTALPPLVVALVGRPRLLLPAALWQSLNPPQRDALLLHELAHLRRGDHLVRWLELLVLGLYWWNPVAWWASRRLRQAEELCCDAWVVWVEPGGAGDYAAALVETVAYLSAVPRRSLAGVSAASPVIELERRLRMILAARTPRRLSWPVGAIVGLVGMALLPLVPTFAQSERPARGVQQVPDPPPVADVKLKDLKSCLNCHQAVQKGTKLANAHHHDEVVRLMDEVAALKARLRTAEERLRQALARFEKAQEKPSVPPLPRAPDPRLEKLDQKLERLLKEVESLRRELRPKRSGVEKPRAGAVFDRREVVYLNQRKFKIPIRVQPERRAEVRELVLYLSRDQGRTWEAHARATPDAKGFDVVADRDGIYCLSVVVMDKQGRQDPPDVYRAPVGQTICVDTVAPVVTMGVAPVKDGTVQLEWDASDDNLDVSTLRLAVREAGKRWKPLPVRQGAKGSVTFTPPGPAWEARLQVADRAGNHSMAKVQYPRQS